MKHEFKVTKSKEQTVYTLESATSGGTSAGSIASMDSTLGGMQRRNPPGDNILAQEKKEVPKPRNFVAKNAKMGGAGQHKDKKKDQKQGNEKYKKPYMEDHEVSMASNELKSIHSDAQKLLGLVQQYGENGDLQAWQQSKITKAADYLNSVLQSIGGEQGVTEGAGANKTHLAMAYLKAVVMAPIGTPEKRRILNWQQILSNQFDIEMDTATLAQMLPQLDSQLKSGQLDRLQNRMAGRGELEIGESQQGVAEGAGANKTHLAMAYLKAVVMAPMGTPDKRRILNWQQMLSNQFDIEMDTATLAQMLPQFDSMLQAGKLDKLQNRMAGRGELEIGESQQGVAEGERTMSRAAKGHEKYGKAGMAALAKAGRDGASEKKLDAIRDKHDNYNEDSDPCWDSHKMVGTKKKGGKSVPNCVPKEGVAEVAGAQKCWPGHRKTGTQAGTGKNAGKRVNNCEKIKEDDSYMESLTDMLERSVSQAQHNLMVGVANNPQFAQKVKVKQQVGQEFANADQGHDISKLPIRVPKKK